MRLQGLIPEHNIYIRYVLMESIQFKTSGISGKPVWFQTYFFPIRSAPMIATSPLVCTTCYITIKSYSHFEFGNCELIPLILNHATLRWTWLSLVTTSDAGLRTRLRMKIVQTSLGGRMAYWRNTVRRKLSALVRMEEILRQRMTAAGSSLTFVLVLPRRRFYKYWIISSKANT